MLREAYRDIIAASSLLLSAATAPLMARAVPLSLVQGPGQALAFRLIDPYQQQCATDE
jgi:hypothetical protein